MDRRIFLLSAAAALGAGPALSATSDLRAAARDLALYGLPLIETAAVRGRMLASGLAANTFRHSRALTTPATQVVTTPNNDTLYSSAWIDLSQGPVRITMPPTGDRYVSLALMDMFTNNFAVLGSRTTGGEGGVFTLVGPKAPLPAEGAIRAPTTWVWALNRILVDGPADLPAVHALQDQFRLQGAAGPRPAPAARRDAAWPAYFSSVQSLMGESPLPLTDLRLLRAAGPLGFGRPGGFDPGRFAPDQQAQIAAGLQDAMVLAAAGDQAGAPREGWNYPQPNLGDYGQDYLYRAQVALGGLAALPLVEAMYLRPLNADGRALFDSARPWRLRFEKGGLPPVDAFWSLTIYRPQGNGQFFLFNNPIDRYAIGDRTPGLVYGPDGSLDIWIARADPGAARRANWLPAPPADPFALTFRAYLPRQEMMSQRYLLPKMVAA